jgi:hypothetical protein
MKKSEITDCDTRGCGRWDSRLEMKQGTGNRGEISFFFFLPPDSVTPDSVTPLLATLFRN